MTSLLALVLTVLAIAYAGLAPLEFHPPNGAHWLAPGPGLRFAREGIVYSEAPFAWSSGGRDFSIDLWFEPTEAPRARVARLLAVQDGDEVPVLSVDQWRGALIVRDRIHSKGRLVYREYALRDALEPGRVHHLTLVGDASGIRAYLDGTATALETKTPALAEGEELSGQLLLGNAARGNQEWSGELRGVAFTAGALSPEAIARRSDASARGASGLASEPALHALYPLDEGRGDAAYDLTGRAPALHVPREFQPLRRTVLGWATTRERSASWYLRDLFVNVAGFLPAGFFGALALAARRPRRRAWLGATLLAAVLSLGIEITQVWLPSRVSSLTDLAGNVAGGALGGGLALAVMQRRSERGAASRPA